MIIGSSKNTPWKNVGKLHPRKSPPPQNFFVKFLISYFIFLTINNNLFILYLSVIYFLIRIFFNLGYGIYQLWYIDTWPTMLATLPDYWSELERSFPHVMRQPLYATTQIYFKFSLWRKLSTNLFITGYSQEKSRLEI